jgi:hypothetical protein
MLVERRSGQYFRLNFSPDLRMEQNRPLARAGYLLAASLFAVPLIDAIMPLLPLRLSEERWRWSAVGQVSNLLLVPLVGILLAIAVTVIVDDRRVRRVLGIICGLLALALAIMSVSFVLDYFQIRTAVIPRLRQASSMASITTGVKNIFYIIILALLARACMVAPKTTPV